MSAVVTESTMLRDLASVCGEQHVATEPSELKKFAIDDLVAAAAVSPGSPEEVCSVLQFASAHRLSVTPAGGFAAQNVGEIPERYDILLRLSRLNGIAHYDPGDLTIGVGAGCTLAQLNSTLAEHNQFLPIEAPCAASTTIGGLLARNAAGPLRHFYGGLRDYCIGIQFVTGDGKLAKAGGRVVKNVAGFDLMKLLIGSYGSLAVLTGANFKVFPRPDRHGELRSFILEFGSLREAIECRDRITRSPLSPLSLEITSPSAHEYLQSTPEPRDADHYSPEHPIHTAAGNWKILLRAAGSENIVARYRRELTDARELSGEGERQLWQHVVNFSNSVLTRHQNAMLLHIELVPSVAAHALAIAQQVATDNNFVMAAVGRAAVTSLTCAFLPLSVDPPSAMQYALAVSAIRAALPLDACIIATRVPTEAKRHFSIWGSSPTDFGSMLAIKRALDPQNILNRGRFLV